jgi:hypothetical protein
VAWGGKASLAAATGITDPRINTLQVTADTGTLERLWIGIRETGAGIAGFDPVLELEDGDAGTDTALASETGASPNGSTTNNKLLTTFSTTTLVKRCQVALSDVAASNFTHFRGQYRALLRCKVSSGTTVGVQLRTGYINTSDLFIGNENYSVTNTGYQLVDLGEVSVPSFATKSTLLGVISDISEFEFRVYAEVITANGGTDTISLDAIVLVPSERMVYAEGLTLNPTFTDRLYVFVNEDGSIEVIETANTDGQIVSQPLRDVRGWEYPVNGGVIVVVGQRSATHELTDQVDTVLKVYPRWLNHRGS